MLDIKWEEREIHVAGDRRLREQRHVHQHRPVLLGSHVEEGGAVEDALLLLLLQVVEDDAGHPHLVQQPRVHVPIIQAAMQQATREMGKREENLCKGASLSVVDLIYFSLGSVQFILRENDIYHWRIFSNITRGT